MNAIAQVVGSLLMFGIAESKHLDLAPWRVMFIVCGAMTAAIGVIFFFAMPSGPSDAWFLNQREREVLMARMARSHEGGDHKDFSMTQLKEALLDYKVFLIFCFGLLVTVQSPVLTVSVGSLCILKICLLPHIVRVSDHQGSRLQSSPNFAVHCTFWGSAISSDLVGCPHVQLVSS